MFGFLRTSRLSGKRNSELQTLVCFWAFTKAQTDYAMESVAKLFIRFVDPVACCYHHFVRNLYHPFDYCGFGCALDCEITFS